MKDYTREETRDIEREINRLIMNHDCYNIRKLCEKEEYALYYFVQKALFEISTLEHIKNIIKEK